MHELSKVFKEARIQVKTIDLKGYSLTNIVSIIGDLLEKGVPIAYTYDSHTVGLNSIQLMGDYAKIGVMCPDYGYGFKKVYLNDFRKNLFVKCLKM